MTVKTQLMNAPKNNLESSVQVSTTPSAAASSPMTDAEFQGWLKKDGELLLTNLNRNALADPAPQPLSLSNAPQRRAS